MRPKIEILDEGTVNRIAAGEVVERPLSIVKELVENAVDAGAKAITVEIKGGGIDMVRVTDNGCGIPKDQVRTAFLPHATSKIRSVEDLFGVRSLGFRGEALSSIAAVSQTEVITKTEEALTGIRYRIDGGKEISIEEIGCAGGTTFIVSNLFFHVPARRKFLKSAVTETGYITEFIQKIAIQRSDIAFKYTAGGANRLVTTGNGSVKDNIYRVYGRDVSDALIPISGSDNGMSLSGYIARPIVARGNRNCEVFFVNGHEVKDSVVEKAVEAAFKPYLMQHRFPFAFIFLNLDPGMVDVNVHPRKSEVKFSIGTAVYDLVERTVSEALKNMEHINRVELAPDEKPSYVPEKKAPEPFENLRSKAIAASETLEGVSGAAVMEEGVVWSTDFSAASSDQSADKATDSAAWNKNAAAADNVPDGMAEQKAPATADNAGQNRGSEPRPVQMDLFEEKIITPQNKPDFRIVGCVFDTYWIIEYRERMLMIDQHAAHEKVMYERFVSQYRERQVVSQYIDPPVIVTLSGRQEETVKKYMSSFNSMGFELESFGGNEYALRAVPSGFMKLERTDVFLGLLDELGDTARDTEDVSVIHDRLAQMSCKAAVKGGDRLSLQEADELLSELLSLENPYNCPHGRPTLVEFTERDLEKFFKRIV